MISLKQICVCLGAAICMSLSAQNKIDNAGRVRMAHPGNEGQSYTMIVEFTDGNVDSSVLPVEVVSSVGDMAIVRVKPADVKKIVSLPEVKRVSMGPELKALVDGEGSNCCDNGVGMSAPAVQTVQRVPVAEGHNCGHGCMHGFQHKGANGCCEDAQRVEGTDRKMKPVEAKIERKPKKVMPKKRIEREAK